MNTIWKFIIPHLPESALELPWGAELLCVQMQGKDICLWAVVDPQAPTERRRFEIVPTGIPFEIEEGCYLGTVQQGPYVWHIFEK